ncbi:hypothetical protein QA641_28470 [Bradyrhizobium sp. CB1650]|uniref:hypothetical protein n=1 Tax=Bradyrhizobium sp. CB1650 TaxID=3039153 RepID=UPI0024360D21|nr:hypothetical protein [Bradyrhizobium sp. CB1650]WGD49555.1 hypothetical protein QA641_28470 [Bradyrhizobium sp. CB1650]
MNRLRYLTIAAVLATVHLLLALSSLLVSFSSGMGRFDSGGDMSQLESLATALSDALLSPISHVQTMGLSPPLQWAVVLGNSILWGAVLAVPVWALARLVKGKRAAF